MEQEFNSNGQSELPSLLTTEQAAACLGMSPKTLAQWRSQGKELEFIRLRRTIRYEAGTIRAYIEAGITRGEKTVDSNTGSTGRKEQRSRKPKVPMPSKKANVRGEKRRKKTRKGNKC